nr:TetR family transcriptional regulator [Streptomyces sp. SUK 48]
MEIARAAAALFVHQGLRATRAEDIAQQAGIAPRTFYRYFATKEEAVAPLYAAGAQRWAEAVRAAPAGLTVPQALEHAAEHTLTPGAGVSAASWEWVRTLIRLSDTSPGLRKVWAEVGQTSEEALAEILARRLTTPGWGAASTEGTGAVAAGAVGEGVAAGETPAGEPYGSGAFAGEPYAGEPYAGSREPAVLRERAALRAPSVLRVPGSREAPPVRSAHRPVRNPVPVRSPFPAPGRTRRRSPSP